MKPFNRKSTLVGLLIAGSPVAAMAEEISPLQKMAGWIDKNSMPTDVLEYAKNGLNLDLSSDADSKGLLLLMAAKERKPSSAPISTSSTEHFRNPVPNISTFDDAEIILMQSLKEKIGMDDDLLLDCLTAMVMGVAT